MFLPYGTGALLVRDGAALRAAHEATADYLPSMPHPEDFYDPSQHGPELSRGFPGSARVAVGEAASARRRFARRSRRSARSRSTPRAASPRCPGIVIDAPPELVAVRVPSHVARRDAGRRGRGDARAHGTDDREAAA